MSEQEIQNIKDLIDTSPSCVREGLDGDLWYKYGADYCDKNGTRMTFFFWAKSADDATGRLKAIKKNAAITGRIVIERIGGDE